MPGGLRVLVARAPGRVNLVGDHTDYNAGLALPMAVDLATEVALCEDDGQDLQLWSAIDPRPATVPIDVPFDQLVLGDLQPPWARLAGAVIAQSRPPRGGVARVTSTVPVGAGLSSSAAFCVALAMACGVEAPPVPMARLCQRAEAAAGADVGLMDPLVSAGGQEGSALLVDFDTLAVEAVPVPAGVDVVVVHSGQDRELSGTPYAARRAECQAAAVEIGVPLGRAEVADLPGIRDSVLRARVRHVISECRRVREFAEALRADDPAAAGRVMVESHRSLAGDFAVSTPVVDALVDTLLAMDGVLGARMTGGGFGGCVVALTKPGAVDPSRWPGQAWRVRPSGGASLTVTPSATAGTS